MSSLLKTEQDSSVELGGKIMNNGDDIYRYFPFDYNIYPKNPFNQEAYMDTIHYPSFHGHKHGYGSKYGVAGHSGYGVGASGFGGGGSGGHSHQQYGPPPPGPHGGSAYPHFSGGGGGHGNGGHTVVVESYQHPRKHKSSKGGGSALTALTLLAFLFFLNILQSCLKEHMQTMNPTVMVMTAGTARRHLVGKSAEDFDEKVANNVSDYTIFTSGIDDKIELRNLETVNFSVNDGRALSDKKTMKPKMNASQENKRN